jgi:hypothetical protein
MRLKLSLTLAASALFAASALAAPARDAQDDQKLIDDFVGTRGISIVDPSEAKKTKTPQRQTAQSSGGRKGAGGAKGGGRKSTSPSASEVAASKKKPASAKTANATPVEGTIAAGPSPDANASGGTASAAPGAGMNDGPNGGATAPPLKTAKAGAQAIGLGYTLFVRQGDSLVSVEPGRVFRANDEIRLALETNTDGYLYIFNAENGVNPTMLFPHNRIDGGANSVTAHASEYVPADMRTGFVFDDVAATERLYIIVSRRPLAGVPTGEALLDHCGGAAREGCYWTPTRAQWDAIMAGAPGAGRVRESRNAQLASAQVSIPSGSLTRGIKVKKQEPAPAVVRVNDSPAADVLVTTLDLVHK